MPVDVSRIEATFTWLSNEFADTDEFKTQSLDILIGKLNLLCNALPWINNQYAFTKKVLNEKKVAAYHRLKASSEANQKYYAITLAKVELHEIMQRQLDEVFNDEIKNFQGLVIINK
jgi:hypothetical protein